MLKKMICLFLCFLLSQVVSAKELSLNTSSEYLKIMGVEKNRKDVMNVILTPFLEGALRGVALKWRQEGVSDKKINAGINALRPHVIFVKDKVVNNINKLMPFDDVVKNIYHPLLLESFDEEELVDIVSFFKTPLGQKYINQSKILMKKSSLLSQKRYGEKIQVYFSGEMKNQMTIAYGDILAALKKVK